MEFGVTQLTPTPWKEWMELGLCQIRIQIRQKVRECEMEDAWNFNIRRYWIYCYFGKYIINEVLLFWENFIKLN